MVYGQVCTELVTWFEDSDQLIRFTRQYSYLDPTVQMSGSYASGRPIVPPSYNARSESGATSPCRR